MKPSTLVPLGTCMFFVGCIWLYTILYNTDWYVEHVHSALLMSIIIIIVFLILFGGIMFILSKFE